jgi:hypothetical protein
MRSAIRGDFARLAERRVEQKLMRVPDEPPDPADETTLPHGGPDEPEPPRSWFARFVSL